MRWTPRTWISPATQRTRKCEQGSNNYEKSRRPVRRVDFLNRNRSSFEMVFLSKQSSPQAKREPHMATHDKHQVRDRWGYGDETQ